MTTYKNTSGDYVITCDDGLGTLTINANVDVVGNVTYIDSSELVVQDPFIVLNNSNTGTYLANSGVLTHTAANTYAGIRYNRSDLAWEITGSTDATGLTGTWSAIAAGNTAFAAGSNTEVQYNDNGVLGASTNYTFNTATNRLTVQGDQVFGNIGATPSYTGNGVSVYNNTLGSGGTGLYVKNAVVNDELVSKSKAIVYAIIF